MSVEIEAKLRCGDLEGLRERLRKAGAQWVGWVEETNIFFDTEDRSLQAADEGLRLRINRKPADGSQTVVMTWKGPHRYGPLKAREEIEIRVDDADAAVAMVERLGFERTLTFEKRRETWRLADCSIELDELPHLGSFVEIEGPNEQTVLQVQQRLGLAESPHISTPYVAMLETYLREHGIRDRVVAFPGR